MKLKPGPRYVALLGVLGLLNLVSNVALAAEPVGNPKPLFRDFLGINGHTVNLRPELYGSLSIPVDAAPVYLFLNRNS